MVPTAHMVLTPLIPPIHLIAPTVPTAHMVLTPLTPLTLLILLIAPTVPMVPMLHMCLIVIAAVEQRDTPMLVPKFSYMLIEIVDLKKTTFFSQVLENKELVKLIPDFGYSINNTLVTLFASKTQIILGSFILGKVFKLQYKDYRKYIENFSSQSFIPQLLIDLQIVTLEIKHPRVFQPNTYFTNLQLNLTPNCNLRCRYCYALSGRKPDHQVMTFEIARKAIDYVSQYCGDSLNLKFVGEGESTTEFILLKRVVNYAKRKIGQVTINPLSTNGIISKQVADWLIKNVKHIQISCDGPAFIQNKYRPLANGMPSSQIVENTVKYLIKKQKDFVVRATMTADLFGNETQIVNYFWQLGVKNLAFGPLEEVGAAKAMIKQLELKQTTKLSNLESLFQEFKKLMELQNELGMDVTVLNFKAIGSTVTCSIYTKSNLVIDPHGNASACDRHNDTSDFIKYPFMQDFIVGGYNSKTKAFKIDLAKVDGLKDKIEHQMNVNGCNDCSLLRACSTICLYAQGHKSGTIDPIIPLCGSIEKISPTITLKYFSERYLINKKPCLQIKNGRLFFSLLYTDFELAVSNGGKNLKKNPYIIIKDVEHLSALAAKIINYKNKHKDLVMVLINFQITTALLNKNTANSITIFLDALQKNKVCYRVTEPLPKILFGQKYLEVCQTYSLPVSYKDCLELYRLKGERVYFARNQIGKRNFSEYQDREDIYKDFLSSR